MKGQTMDITPELAQDLMREWTPARVERISAQVARAQAVADAPAGPDCIGFADCPCRRCAATRYVANESHPIHAVGQGAYCAACRFAAREHRPHYPND